jgi:hypothetical protein
MVLSIPIAYLLFFLIQISSGISFRKSLIRSYLFIFGFTAIATELLSCLSVITLQAVFLMWVLLCGGLLVWVLSKLVLKGWLPRIKDIRFIDIRDWTWCDFLLIAIIAFILIITLVVAFLAPPNNYDSMTYHMARVANWIQQRSVRFYPTSIPRQNYSMPLAEYMILHLQLLSKSDFFANLVQWSGFAILILLAMEMAEKITANKKGQLLAGVFTATLPMAILQSTNTQNDIVTAVFCMVFADSLASVIKEFSWKDAVIGGVAFGLALLTKGTAYIFCAAIGSVFGVGGLISSYRSNRLKLLPFLIAMILIAAVFNGGFLHRNLDLYGRILSPETGHVTTDEVTLEGVFSNLLRNGLMHLALPFPPWNQGLNGILQNHFGDMLSNPETTFPGSVFQIHYVINEDESGNLLHFILLVGMILALPFFTTKEDRRVYLYLASLIFCILLYSVLLKWQPWGTRLQLAIFALAAPLFGYGMAKLKNGVAVGSLVGLILAVYSLPYLFLNSTRPLIPLFPKTSVLRSNRVKRFFSDHPDLYNEYAEIIAPFYKDISVLHTPRQRLYFSSNMSYYQDYIDVSRRILELDAGDIGLNLGANDWEYPLWVLTGRHFSEGFPHFVHVAVKDQSAALLPVSDTGPDYVVSSENADWEYLVRGDYKVILDTQSLDLNLK